MSTRVPQLPPMNSDIAIFKCSICYFRSLSQAVAMKHSICGEKYNVQRLLLQTNRSHTDCTRKLQYVPIRQGFFSSFVSLGAYASRRMSADFLLSAVFFNATSKQASLLRSSVTPSMIPFLAAQRRGASSSVRILAPLSSSSFAPSQCPFTDARCNASSFAVCPAAPPSNDFTFFTFPALASPCHLHFFLHRCNIPCASFSSQTPEAHGCVSDNCLSHSGCVRPITMPESCANLCLYMYTSSRETACYPYMLAENSMATPVIAALLFCAAERPAHQRHGLSTPICPRVWLHPCG